MQHTIWTALLVALSATVTLAQTNCNNQFVAPPQSVLLKVIANLT